MSSIVLGKAGARNVTLDVDGLLRGRMLVQANSGKGKSWLLRRIAEQLFGKVPVIIIDPEGEFATLREKFGYVLVGKGGETPADPRSAALVAHKLLELRASAVCDLYEMKPFARHEWVQRFLDAMIDAPKNLWHPCVFIADEAHTYCPEKGAGESVASEAMIAMSTRGRKRGFALIAATQRLGKLRKDLAAELLNIMIGGTFIDIDRKRAADALGVYGKDIHGFFDEIKLLERGSFFCLGPAISDERLLCKVGPVETTHPEAGSSKHASEPPPAPDAIAKMLPKLSDLPKQAEEKAKTEAEYRTQIRDLKSQLAMANTKVTSREAALAVSEGKKKGMIDHGYIKNVTQLLKEEREYSKKLNDYFVAFFRKLRDEVGKMRLEPPKRELSKKAWQVDSDDKTTVSGSHAVHIPHRTETRPPAPQHAEPRRTADVALNGDLSGSQVRILKALAELDAIGQSPAAKETVAFWSEQRSTSGGYFNNLGKLRGLGLIDYPAPGTARLTEEGRQKIGNVEAPSSEEVIRRVESLLSGSQIRILQVLREVHPESITKDDLAERSGQTSTSGGYFNNLGSMRTAGLLDYPRPGTVKAADWLFWE